MVIRATTFSCSRTTATEADGTVGIIAIRTILPRLAGLGVVRATETVRAAGAMIKNKKKAAELFAAVIFYGLKRAKAGIIKGWKDCVGFIGF